MKSLFTPLTMGGMNVPNRTVVAPLSRVSAGPDGVPTADMAAYYRAYAKGQFGMIISEGTYTDTAYAQGYANQPGLVNERQLKGWQNVVSGVHSEGSRMILQLMHAGALSQSLDNTVAPSAIQPLRKKMPAYGGEGPFAMPAALTLSQIDDVIEGFVGTAKRAVEAGFDGVEVHAANGYLLDQFITAYTNQRSDRYGGSVENRIRLTAEIIAAIRANVPDNFYVGVRVSQGKVNDFDYLWPGGVEDGNLIFKALKAAGAQGIHFASEGAGFEHGCLTFDGVSLPRLARTLTGLPVIANGGMHHLKQALWALDEGHGDLVSLGTGAIANPDWPQKVAQNQPLVEVNEAMFSHGVTLEAVARWRRDEALSFA